MRSKVERPRCAGHNKDGEQCRAAPLRGTTVCRMHGGAAPQVRKKAAERLEQASDRMAQQLLAIAEDKAVPAAVRLAAIRDALDRAGLHKNSDITVAVAPWQAVFEAVVGNASGPVEVEVLAEDEAVELVIEDYEPFRAVSHRVDISKREAMAGSARSQRRKA